MKMLAIACLAALTATLVQGEELEVRVVDVLSTNTLMIECSTGMHKVCLHGAKDDDILGDLPEAMSFLEERVLGRDVIFLVHRKFMSGFMTGTIFLDGDVDLSVLLIEQGYALWDEAHCREYTGYGDFVHKARETKVGMWSPEWQAERERLAPIVKARQAEEMRLRRERALAAHDAAKSAAQSGNSAQEPSQAHMAPRGQAVGSTQAELARAKEEEERAKAMDERQQALLRERDLRDQDRARRETVRHTSHYDETMPSLTVKNTAQSGAIVKVIGPTRATLFVGGRGFETINLRPGTYFIVAKLGVGADAMYCEGERFAAEAASTHVSRTTIILSATLGGNYGTRQISEAQFNRY